MPQFFVKSDNIKDKEISIIENQDIKHIKDVLRHKVNDKLTLVDDKQKSYKVKIIKIQPEIIQTTILEKYDSGRKLSINLELAQCILKSQAQDFAVQKATELGIKAIIPVISKFTVVKFKNEKEKLQKQSRWQKIAFESCKQCERIDMPEIRKISTLKELITAQEHDLAIACVERHAGMSMKKLLKEKKEVLSKDSKLLVIIGPEGGWSNDELNLFKEHLVPQVSIGNLILRAETAIIKALSDIIYELEPDE